MRLRGTLESTFMANAIRLPRRRFLEAGLITLGATQLRLLPSALAEPGATKAGTNGSFGPLKQIDAGLLNVGYAEVGPINGPPVILLHGWPYDIYTYADVVPLLAVRGYRVIVPYLRGYGTTQFLSRETFRNGQQAAFAVDIMRCSMR